MSWIFPDSLQPLYIVALLAAVLVCARARAIGEYLHVMAYPDAGRKRHARATPQLGGVAILSAMTIWIAGAMFFGDRTGLTALSALLCCGMGVGLVGFTDDQHNTSPLSRMLSLGVFLVIAVTINPGLITNTLHWVSLDAGHIATWAYCAITAVAVLGLVNAINMADGQDGIVGSMFAIWAACLILVTQGQEQDLARLLLGASVIFVGFNLNRRLFLGDCGTYGVSFVLAMMAIHAHSEGRVHIETIIVWFFIPVMDCLRLLITRPLRGRSPFNGDRDHFHHRLEDKLGKNWGFGAYAGCVAITSLVATVEPRFSLLSLTVLCAFYFSFAWLTDAASFAKKQIPEPSDSAGLDSNVLQMTAGGKAKSGHVARRLSE